MTNVHYQAPCLFFRIHSWREVWMDKNSDLVDLFHGMGRIVMVWPLPWKYLWDTFRILSQQRRKGFKGMFDGIWQLVGSSASLCFGLKFMLFSTADDPHGYHSGIKYVHIPIYPWGSTKPIQEAESTDQQSHASRKKGGTEPFFFTSDSGNS